jgi:hypothetical protein
MITTAKHKPCQQPHVNGACENAAPQQGPTQPSRLPLLGREGTVGTSIALSVVCKTNGRSGRGSVNLQGPCSPY